MNGGRRFASAMTSIHSATEIKRLLMVVRPTHLNVRTSSSALRARQLLAGCVPRVEGDQGRP